ncbi:MAG: UDP-N-acetylmuramate dehydrogenase [Saprospiraceae bacterium]|nr:UDP-N-acetylmuramate dehydrogenase [Lewinella sp.]
MLIHQSLFSYNSFGIDVHADLFTAVRSIDQLAEILIKHSQPKMVLGGGSNVLFTHDPESIILHNQILGKEVFRQSDTQIVVRIGGGENWHQVVLWCLENNWGGVENLSLIPGTVGAAPIQNIGAYGVELKDVFFGLDAIDLTTGQSRHFSPNDAQFGYRDSIFKRELKGKLFITHVYFQLSRNNHQINTEYGAIREMLDQLQISQPGIQDVSRAVVAIRRSKLPDPKELGNAGSFFKNPEIDAVAFDRLQAKFPSLVFYALDNNRFKLPAGWLIDQCGWKGKRLGPVGCYEKQALVLVNYGGATGQDVLNLASRIMDSVEERFGIRLEPEVNIL